jgi:putative ABC transport system substrate-binding protein
MRRRDFIAAFAGAAVFPIAARAQQPKKVARIGFLFTGSLESPEIKAFYQGLREYGYIDGQNVIVEVRTANSIERFPALASELVGLNVDVIVASNSIAGRAVQRATATIRLLFQ